NRPLASDSKSKYSSSGGVRVSAVGVGTDFRLYGYGYTYPCGTATIGPLKGSLFIDGVRVGKLESMLIGSYRGMEIDSYELQDGASPQSSPAASPTDPDTPTGTRIAAMRTTSDPQCSVTAEVSVSRSTPQGWDSWDVYRNRIGTARVATVANTGDSVS